MDDNTPASSNGAPDASERRHVRERLARIAATRPDETGKHGSQQTAAAKLHSVPRHPEDPPETLKIGVGEESLLDPDAHRVNAVDVGITMQALRPDEADPLVEQMYDGLLGVRAGAVVGQSIEEAGPLAATEAATDRDVEAIAADGERATTEAAAYRKETLPRLKTAWKKAKKAHKKAVAKLARFEDEAAENTNRKKAATDNPTPVGGSLHWLPISLGRAAGIAAAEIALGGLVLSGPVGDAISIELPFGSLFVAMALSGMLVGLGWFAGKALGGVGLPSRLVAALFVVAAVIIVARSMHSLDALRMGRVTEGKTLLTAGTLSTIYIAALTSWAASLYGLFERRRELISSVPTPADLWVIKWDRLKAKVVETKDALDAATVALAAGFSHVESLESIAAGAPAECRRREAEGIKAGVALETLSAVTHVHLEQEESNTSAAMGAYKASHRKTQAEAYPTADPSGCADADVGDAGVLNMFHRGAIAALLLGALGGLLGVQIVLTLGAAAAAVLLLAGMSSWARDLWGEAVPVVRPVNHSAPVSDRPGAEGAPGWKTPPRSTKPKHFAGPNDPTQSH